MNVILVSCLIIINSVVYIIRMITIRRLALHNKQHILPRNNNQYNDYRYLPILKNLHAKDNTFRQLHHIKDNLKQCTYIKILLSYNVDNPHKYTQTRNNSSNH